jgi:hypothetical protein
MARSGFPSVTRLLTSRAVPAYGRPTGYGGPAESRSEYKITVVTLLQLPSTAPRRASVTVPVRVSLHSSVFDHGSPVRRPRDVQECDRDAVGEVAYGARTA